MQMMKERAGRTEAARSIRLMLLGVLPAAMLSVTAGCHGPKRSNWGEARGQAIKAVWVTRWDYKSASDITTIMETCRSAGFNTVLFQVRGNGTAFYRSKLEPWADELGGRDPGFDPLAVACQQAHRRGMSLQAWVNVMPGWRGKQPPKNPQQLYHARANWFWRDSRGKRQPLGWYNSVNPCYPEVRRYLVDVMREIVAGYPVDGLHLDYIRFPNEWNPSYPQGAGVPDYPRDRRTLALFRKETGQTPDSSPQAWNQWRTEKVTQLLRDIRRMMKAERPTAQLTAAVGADPAIAKRTHFQDSRKWLAEGLLDGVFPMNYTASMAEYGNRLQYWRRMQPGVPVVMGVMADNRDGSTVKRQLQEAYRAHRHAAVFAYSSLFDKLDGRGRPIRDKGSASRAARRREVIPELKRSTGQRT